MTDKFDVALLINAYLLLKQNSPHFCDTLSAIHSHIEELQRWLVLEEMLQKVNGYYANLRYQQIIEAFVLRDENIKSSSDKSILCAIASLGYHRLVSDMIAAGADPETEDGAGGDSCLLYACRNGQTETVRVLLNHGARINVDDPRYFVHPRVIDVLFDNHALGINHHPRILFYAVESGRFQIVEHLIHLKASLNVRNKNNKTPLMLAASLGYMMVVKVLVDAKSPFDGALIEAVRHNHYQIAKYLLPLASANEITEALIYAVRQGMVDLAAMLIAGGADVDVTDNQYGDNLLLWCAEHRQTTMLKILLENGANPNLTNREGFTPLMFAAWTGDLGAIAALKKAGADVNARNRFGSTALVWAVEGQQYDAVCTLILAGADVSIRNNTGQCVLEKTIKEGDMSMANLLYTGRIRQLCLMLKTCPISQVAAIIQSQKSEGIDKSYLVDYILQMESDPDKRLALLRQAIATDASGKATNALSHFMHISQGIGFRKYFFRERSWAVVRIKSAINQIQQEKGKRGVDIASKFR